MNQTAFFAMLGAPLVNPRWSWGAVRPGDGVVFLKVWEDRIRGHGAAQFAQVTFNNGFRNEQDSFRHRQRVDHVARVRAGARCYLIRCQAADPTARPRRVRQFNDCEVYPGRQVLQRDGDWWVEMLPGIPVQQVVPSPIAGPA